MATTYRRRHNLLSNTLGAALATGATSITFGSALQEGGSNIATLGTDEYLPLTIENEIVYLTAYTAGATTGTVVRARENTVDPGVDHANGTAVRNASTADDIGGILSVTSYQPTTQTIISTTSSSFADVDATNAVWTFIAPKSGKVILSAEAFTDAVSTNLGSGDRYVWGLHDGTADVAATAQSVQRCSIVNQTYLGRAHIEWLVTGLTPGTRYTYKLRHEVTNAVVTGRIIVGTKDTATVIWWGALVMKAVAVP